MQLQAHSAAQTSEPLRNGLHRVWLIPVIGAVLLTYSPVFFYDYGFSEDYRLLAFFDRGGATRHLMIAEGRPLQALWANIVFARFTTIESLAWLRFVNVLLLGCLAGLFAIALTEARWRRRDAAAIGIALLTLPPFQVFAASASMGAVPVAALLAGCAGLVAGRATAKRNPKQFWTHVLAAVTLLTAAIATYQPAAMLYWVFAAILLIVSRDRLGVFKRQLITLGGIGAVALVSGFLLYRAGNALYASELAGLQRSRTTLDVFAKLGWFIQYPMRHALNFWKLIPDARFALAMAAAISAGMILHTRSATDGRVLRLATAAVLVPACYLPSLSVAENWSSFRSQIALVCIVFTYFAITFGSSSRTSLTRFRTVALPALTVIGVLSALYGVTCLFALPQARELVAAREAIKDIAPASTSLVVVMADGSDSLAPALLYDEFGRPSTSMPWSAVDLPFVIMRELHPGVPVEQFHVVLVSGASTSGASVIDWRAVLRAAKQ